MKTTVLTNANIKFIKAYRLKLSGTDMAKSFGVSKSVVNRYMRNHGLSVPHKVSVKFRSQAMVGRTTSTPEIDRIIKRDYLVVPVKTLAANINKSHCFLGIRLRQLGLVIPKEIIEERKNQSRYQPGRVPENKGKKMRADVYKRCAPTMFKKGQLPVNTAKKDGEVRTRHNHLDRGERPYKYIRISLGKWIPYHKYKWEKKHGPIPKGHCLWFIDGNTLNVTLKNLELITREENIRRNTIQRYPKDIQLAMKRISKLKNKIANAKEQNN